jgi:hypothetical protein
MLKCRDLQSLIPELFKDADFDVCSRASARDDFSEFTAIPLDIRQHLEACSCCSNDLLWFLEIRFECDVKSFPCIHMAYACSTRANQVISKHADNYILATNEALGVGIVIGFCPWCAKGLSQH